MSAMLSAALDKANSRNADISDLYEAERNRNKHIISDSDVECQQKVATTSFQNAAVVSHGGTSKHAVALLLWFVFLYFRDLANNDMIQNDYRALDHSVECSLFIVDCHQSHHHQPNSVDTQQQGCMTTI